MPVPVLNGAYVRAANGAAGSCRPNAAARRCSARLIVGKAAALNPAPVGGGREIKFSERFGCA